MSGISKLAINLFIEHVQQTVECPKLKVRRASELNELIEIAEVSQSSLYYSTLRGPIASQTRSSGTVFQSVGPTLYRLFVSEEKPRKE